MNAKGSVFKYQAAFNEDVEEIIENTENVLHLSRTGSVYNIIVRGDMHEWDEKMRELKPILCERINLTLEEVFIYELGGLGYDFENIIF